MPGLVATGAASLDANPLGPTQFTTEPLVFADNVTPAPLQGIDPPAEADTVGAVASVSTTAVAVELQLPELTVTVYVPAALTTGLA